MSKLTQADIHTLNTFFAGARSTLLGSDLVAQSYEPKGKGYDPATDTRLASLILRGVRSGKSEWTKASLVVDQLCGRPGGGAHLDVLRRACSSRASVGAHTARAMVLGRELAKDAARMSELESEYRMCVLQQCSGFDTTARVLELDAKLRMRSIEVSLHAVLDHAFTAVDEGLIDVDGEIDALIDSAADALHAARDRVAEAERTAKAREEQRCADLRAELAGRREAKQRARFERRLRKAS